MALRLGYIRQYHLFLSPLVYGLSLKIMSDSTPVDSQDDDVPLPGLPEDIIAIVAGMALLAVAVLAAFIWGSYDIVDGETILKNPLKAWIGKPDKWSENPWETLRNTWVPTMGALVLLGVFLVAMAPLMRPLTRPLPFLGGFVLLFLLAGVSYLLAGQEFIRHYNLEYALWALLVGMIIGNTVGKQGLGSLGEAAVRPELFIKTGLVMFGAEILFSRLMELGLPGVMVSWVVTPIVLITTFWFGQRILKMSSPSLNMVISADMSVCGVSAAIATAAACRAKREELSVAIGLSLCFTAGMMVVMPMIIPLMGLSDEVGGAWIGGTIDATGAVAVAGGLLGKTALEVALTVKMIQNILIGAIAFAVAVYWTTRVDTQAEPGTAPQVGIGEIWRRFPKFVLGFLAASILFSIMYGWSSEGELLVGSTHSVSKVLRGWLFALAFVCIGVELNFRQLADQFHGGKPLVLYVCGQSLNLILTLTMAYIAFGVLGDFFFGTSSQ